MDLKTGDHAKITFHLGLPVDEIFVKVVDINSETMTLHYYEQGHMVMEASYIIEPGSPTYEAEGYTIEILDEMQIVLMS